MLIIDCGAVPSNELTKQALRIHSGIREQKMVPYLFNKRRILCFSE